jgi:formylmethanofuran dehydrogenase subunit E
MTINNTKMNYPQIVSFHGHACPGLAIGYRMASEAMKDLAESRADDEELVAIVENDACGVDALQCVTGCTFGKGNLIFRDYGKSVYTIYSRTSGKGVRVLFDGQKIPEKLREKRDELMNWILAASREDILTVTKVSIEEPTPARVRKSLPCAFCNEMVMETRLHEVDGKQACTPCAQHHGVQA